MKPVYFLPFAGVVAIAGYLGWQMGKPLSETEVLDFHAAQWVADGPAGAAATDCYGLPGVSDDVWITVICQHADGTVRRTPVARNGRAMAAQDGPET